MATWRSKLARSAWTAFLLLFAVRAIAGTALCEIYGGHRAPPVSPDASFIHAPQEAHQAHKHALRTEQPSNDSKGHVCEEPAPLTGGPTFLSAIKWSLTVDAIAWSHAPGRNWEPVVAMVSVAPPQLAHPPPPRAPLDIAPRLRI
ncbi:hypothetical protein [Variovorax sp. JS1663]|uniref:hypothetical protein n=1 Tax=Variovorax sp. JS1663 TaxID=1851577 RepID=UPI000B3490B5|nr:hypothetical protein [Variovorax sp. JS1663]OUM00430.1 hypothetical protein A8M77_21510 [Variovorax sp. JS1663]